MRKKISILIVFTLLLSLLVPQTAYAKVSFREASINDFDGTVKVIIGGGQKQYDAYKGMGLTQGDTVITAEGSSVTLYIDDDKEIKLGANSRLTLSELSNYIDEQSKSTGLKLWAGKIWVNVKKKLNIRSKFEITTGSTVMGVKGTQFFVGYEADSSQSSQARSSGTVGPIEVTTSGADSAGSKAMQTELVVLQGMVAATIYAPSQLPEAGGAPVGLPTPPTTVNVGANERLTFNADQLQGTKPPQPEPVQQQDLDLLVLEQIAQQPQDYAPSLTQNLDSIIRQMQEKEEQARIQREAELAQRPTPPPPQYLDMSRSIPTPSLTPTPTQRPTPTPQAVIYNSPTPIPLAQPSPSVKPTPSAMPTPSLSPSPDPSGAPSQIPGNETVTINTPVINSYINTQDGLSIAMTATNHENDLQGVKVSLRRGAQGLYYDASTGAFTSQTRIYTNAIHEGSHWYLSLSPEVFTQGGDFPCIISAIAYDSADGTAATGAFNVDNSIPVMCSDSDSMPMGLYPDNVDDYHTRDFKFSEKLSNDAMANVENVIGKHIISGGDNLKYTWNYDEQSHDQDLTLGLKSVSGEAIEFMDSEDIKTTISDLAGNESTITLYNVNPVDAPDVSPKYVTLDGEEHGYHTGISEFEVPLPDGHYISSFMQGLLEDSLTDWGKYISLGGVLADCTVTNAALSYVDDHPMIFVKLETDAEGNINIADEGEGTITLSTRLWDGPGAFRTRINFSPHVIGLTATTYETPDEVKLLWSDDLACAQDIKVEVSDVSATEGFSEDTDTQVDLAGNCVILNGYEPGKDYWFRVKVIGGYYNGYTCVVHYTLPLLTATMDTIAPVSIDWAQETTRSLVINVPNPETSTVNVTCDDESIAGINVDGPTLYIHGRKPGSTNVTVTVSMPGYSDITQTFLLTVNEPQTVPTTAEPSEINAGYISDVLYTDTTDFEIQLPQGITYNDLFADCFADYILLEGALSGCEVTGIESVNDYPDKVRIKLRPITTFEKPYVPIDNMNEAAILISARLWNGGDAVLSAGITVSIQPNQPNGV